MDYFDANGMNRRAFLRNAAIFGGVLVVGACGGTESADLAAESAGSASADGGLAKWASQPGLELYTVRDQLSQDLPGTLAKVAGIGYKEVEPTGYGDLTPQQYRALLDQNGLTAPSTHASAETGADFEKTLEGYAVIGHKYTSVRTPRPENPAPRAQRASDGTTRDDVRRRADDLNAAGQIAKQYGIKILIHNHTGEFEKLADNPDMTTYDVLLAETDPSVVAMQLDIGWAAVAGQDILGMFQKTPGRFELWHVKDATGITGLDPSLTPNQRREKATLVPVGKGEIDYATIFANADLAGLQHYCIEQDNAADDPGGSVVAATTSYQDLMGILA